VELSKRRTKSLFQAVFGCLTQPKEEFGAKRGKSRSSSAINSIQLLITDLPEI